MMYKKPLILLLAAVAITGCGSSTPPPVARKPGTYTALMVPAVADKWAGGIVRWAAKEKNGCGRFSANVLPNPVNEDYIVDIEADRDIFFHIARTGAAAECNQYGMFYATKGNEYTVKFEIKNKQCEFSLLEKSANGVQRKISTYAPYVSNVDGVKVCENKDRLY